MQVIILGFFLRKIRKILKLEEEIILGFFSSTYSHDQATAKKCFQTSPSPEQRANSKGSTSIPRTSNQSINNY